VQQEKHTNSKQKKQLKSNEKFQQQQTENITKILHKKVKNARMGQENSRNLQWLEHQNRTTQK
jgi:hypothetical protein